MPSTIIKTQEIEFWTQEFERIKPFSDSRHSNGEYYTPFWLAQHISWYALDIWLKENGGRKNITVLDPACGNGVFLAAFLKALSERESLPGKIDIVGIDMNPKAIEASNELLDGFSKAIGIPNINLELINKDFLAISQLKADIIIGNPPWVVLRNIEDFKYKEHVKSLMADFKVWGSQSHLATQLDLSALFFIKCLLNHLGESGIIGFVMPGSIYPATTQHEAFWLTLKKHGNQIAVWDLRKIPDLFPIPSNALFVKNSGQRESIRLFELVKDNAGMRILAKKENHGIRPETTTKSYYYDYFKVGASMFPRCFYFVDIVNERDNILRITTSERILKSSKPPWGQKISGNVRKQFIYQTILANNIVPFGYKALEKIPLPMQMNPSMSAIIHELNEHKDKEDWFSRCEVLWNRFRTETSEKRFPTLCDRLNYNSLLKKQFPTKRFIVIYAATGSNINSTVLDRNNLERFIVDVKCWYFQTDNSVEAYYLSAILNSDYVNNAIKTMQPRGLWGPRAIHRLPLMLPIPKYDCKSELCKELSQIAQSLFQVVNEYLNNRRNVTRREVRNLCLNHIHSIDELAKELLEGEQKKCQKPTLFHAD
jgi:methylase of polypeptide subunit release factors